MQEASHEITRILDAMAAGDPEAGARLFECIYDELHVLAAAQMRGERADHTLQPTALVHEAYVRLLGFQKTEWANRTQFFGAAAEVMRRILVDHARAHQAAKRGGGRAKAPLDSRAAAASSSPDELLAIDEALCALEEADPEKARIVKLRFFAGLSHEETAAAATRKSFAGAPTRRGRAPPARNARRRSTAGEPPSGRS